jgi:hypothetical protein
MKRREFLAAGAVSAAGLAAGSGARAAEGYMIVEKLYNRKILGVVGVGVRESVGLNVMLDVKERDLDLYRPLLPAGLDMPEKPRIMIYIYNFMKTHPLYIGGGYREAAVCMSARCSRDKRVEHDGWHVLEMPVSSKAALRGGLLLGYPKFMADISLVQEDGEWTGRVAPNPRCVIDMTFQEAEVNVPWKDELHLAETFYLFKGDGLNIMELEIIREEKAEKTSGSISLSLDSDQKWRELLPQGKIQASAVKRTFKGLALLTRRSE